MFDAGLAKLVHVLFLDSRKVEEAGLVDPATLGHHLAELGEIKQGIQVALLGCDVDECLDESHHVF